MKKIPSPSSLWIISFSVRIYQWLIRMGPVGFRHEYGLHIVQVFRQCCRDAYQAQGVYGVMRLWLPMFGEAVTGMLVEHLCALRSFYERMGQMLLGMRRSMLITLGAFIFFAMAYLFLMQVADPRRPLDAIASAHLDIQLAFAFINWGAAIAFMAVVLGGLPILFVAVKHAIAEKRSNPLALFMLRPKQVVMLVALTLIVEVGFFAFLITAQFIAAAPSLPRQTPIVPLPPLEIASQLGVITLFTFLLLAGTALITRIILRSEFSAGMLRYALIPMTITTLAMGVSFVATIVWLVRLWVDVPQFADSQGLGVAGLRGDIGGSEGVVVIVVMMALAAAVAAFACGRGLRSRMLASA